MEVVQIVDLRRECFQEYEGRGRVGVTLERKLFGGHFYFGLPHVSSISIGSKHMGSLAICC